MLRGYFRRCIREALLAVLKDHIGCQGLNLILPYARQTAKPLYYFSDPRVTVSLFEYIGIVGNKGDQTAGKQLFSPFMIVYFYLPPRPSLIALRKELIRD